MNTNDATACIAYAQSLWPGWDPDDADLDAWRNLFARIRSPDLARQGLQTLKTTTDWKSPKRAQVLDLLSRQTGPMHSETPHDGSCGMYIQCVSHPDKPSMLGHFSTLYWPTDKDMPDGDTIYRHMEEYRKEQQGVYGGEWQLIRSFNERITEGDMLRRRAELKPKPHGKPSGPMMKLMATCEAAADRARQRDAEATAAHQPARQAVGDFLAGQKPRLQGPPE